MYNCLWSHAGGVPGHIHYLVQPVTSQQMSDFDAFGPELTMAMFGNGQVPARADVERVVDARRNGRARSRSGL